MTTTSQHDEILTTLIEFAHSIGFTQVARIAPSEIKVEASLAANCLQPKCPSYGMSASCPPHVGGPAAIRKFINRSRHGLVLRLEVDSASLMGAERPQVFRLLHELTATVENEGRNRGFSFALGFAGGSCKESFCANEEECAKLTETLCRHPTLARQSMSGFGINVGELMKSSDWSATLFSASDPDTKNLSWVAGLVLLGD